MARAKYLSTLQYSVADTLIIDNRPTSLFKDYYKVIGSRYKFSLEDLVKTQEQNAASSTDTKFRRFMDNFSITNLDPENTGIASKIYAKYQESLAPSAEAKKKLMSRQRRRVGPGSLVPVGEQHLEQEQEAAGEQQARPRNTALRDFTG